MSIDDPVLEILSVEELDWMHPLVRDLHLMRCHWIQDYVDACREKEDGIITKEAWLDRVRYGGAITNECDRQLREMFPHDVLTGGYRD